MALNDPLANTLSAIENAERVGKDEVKVKPVSKIIKEMLELMKDNGYIGEISEIEDGRGKYYAIKLVKKINKCKAVKPRYPVKIGDYEKFEKRYLIAKDFGIMIISTNKGMMTHYQAKKENIGGRLLAFCY